MNVTPSQRAATSVAIKKIAYFTARTRGKNQKAAIEHCLKLGVDYKAKTFEEATR